MVDPSTSDQPTGDAETQRGFSLVGPGRAGTSLRLALEAAGWQCHEVVGRDQSVAEVAHGVSLVVIATPDRDVADVVAAIEPDPDAVILHVSGAIGLDVFGSHAHGAAMHPLVSIPDAETGLRRLSGGAWFGVAGTSALAHQLIETVVADLDGHLFDVADADRASYHAAACIASNHLVALMGQVERIAAPLGVPREAFADLVAGTLENVRAQGPAGALTGPVRRQDWATVARHMDALDPSEQAAYVAMAAQAARLVPPTHLPARLLEEAVELAGWHALGAFEGPTT